MVEVFEPRELMLGDSTAEPGVVDYRLGILRRHVPVRGRWLDCGCADGAYSEGLMHAGASEVVGADVEEERVGRARARRAEGLSFVVARAEELPFEDGTFDGVLLNEVLEHVGDQEAALAELRRVLAPGGALVVFSPNRWFPFEGHGAVLGRLRLPFPVPLLPWLPQRLGRRFMTARNYWPRQLAAAVAAAGLEVEAVDFALPLFARYRWLPEGVAAAYRRALPRIERRRLLRRFGVSTVVVARRGGG